MRMPSLKRRAGLTAAVVALALAGTLGLHLVIRGARPLAGLEQSIYDNPDAGGTAVRVRQTTALDVTDIRADATLPQRQMSVRWRGFWYVPNGGPIRVSVMADDEVRLWLDGVLVADRHVTEGYRTHVDPVVLEPGVHAISVEYVQYGGGMSVDLAWAPLGTSFRRFAPDRLFVESPDDAALMRAARVRTLRAVEPVVWRAAGLAALVLLLLPGAASLGRAIWRSPRRRRAWSVLSAVAGNRRVQVVLAGGAALGAVWWALLHRLDALNPLTLWADDIWVAALASRPSLAEALGTPGPVPPGFVLLQWMARHAASDPAPALQVLPLTFGVLCAVLLGGLAARVTGSRALGLVALVLALLDPFMAQVSVFSKQYTLDGLIAVVLLALAVRGGGAGPARLPVVAACGVTAALFSFPSVFVSVALVHVLAAGVLLGATDWLSRRRALVTAAAFDAALLVVYWLVLQPRRSQTMTSGWSSGFMPTDEVEAGLSFIMVRGGNLLTQALPETLQSLVLFFAVGLLWFLLGRRWRIVGLAVACAYGGLLLASALGIYPIERGYGGRTVLFSSPLVQLLIVCGIGAVTRLLPARTAVNTVLAVLALGLLARAPAAVRYFDHDHSVFARVLVERAQPGDGVIVNDRASYVVGVYTDWASVIAPSHRPEQFYLRFVRPLTVTLPPRAEDGEGLDELATMLEVESPERLFYFSTRRETGPAEKVIADAGYRLTAGRSSTTRTHFYIYER